MQKSNSYKYDISVIITTYNSDFRKIRQTILSVIFQKEISLEIIIADDGSTINFEKEIENLFDMFGFYDYKLVMNSVNLGTIKNYISALAISEGEFIKGLSPGDYLSGETILSDWVHYIKERRCDWSFSEVINYHYVNGKETFLSAPAQPVYIEPYINVDEQRIRWNYVVLDDAAIGCAIAVKTKIMLNYIHQLADNNIKYAEDYMFRMMMFDGICGCYFPYATTFYENGTGISSGKNKKWKDILFSEYIKMNQLLDKRSEPDSFQKKMLRYTRRKKSSLGMLFVPGKLRRFLKLHFIPRYFPVDFDATAEWREKCR